MDTDEFLKNYLGWKIKNLQNNATYVIVGKALRRLKATNQPGYCVAIASDDPSLPAKGKISWEFATTFDDIRLPALFRPGDMVAFHCWVPDTLLDTTLYELISPVAQVTASKPTKDYPHVCLSCGAPGYQGFSYFECSNPKCNYYNP